MAIRCPGWILLRLREAMRASRHSSDTLISGTSCREVPGFIIRSSRKLSRASRFVRAMESFVTRKTVGTACYHCGAGHGWEIVLFFNN